MTVLIFSSCAFEQGALVSDALARLRKETLSINLLRICEDGPSLAYGFTQDGGREILLDGKPVSIEAIIWNSRPRADAALAFAGAVYTATYRSRLSQFFQEFSDFCDELPQFPGTLANVSRSESKISLLRRACGHGLTVPHLTWNIVGGSSVSACHSRHGRLYRKVLGPACVVTEDGSGITTTNIAVDGWGEDFPGSFQPWQFQTIIPFIKHIRCAVVGNRVWAAEWNHSPKGDVWDLRHQQDMVGSAVSFNPHELPIDVIDRLTGFVQSEGLSHAAPEFLMTRDGQCVFIDLNPCGEWTNVFGAHVEGAIARSLAMAVAKRIK